MGRLPRTVDASSYKPDDICQALCHDDMGRLEGLLKPRPWLACCGALERFVLPRWVRRRRCTWVYFCRCVWQPAAVVEVSEVASARATNPQAEPPAAEPPAADEERL